MTGPSASPPSLCVSAESLTPGASSWGQTSISHPARSGTCFTTSFLTLLPQRSLLSLAILGNKFEIIHALSRDTSFIHGKALA